MQKRKIYVAGDRKKSIHNSLSFGHCLQSAALVDKDCGLLERVIKRSF